MVAALGRWYDVDIRLDGAVTAARRVTLITEPNQPLTEVLTALTLPLGLRAAWSERTVVIRP